MDALMRVLAAKKREASQLQAEKKPSEKYLRRAEVEALRLEREAAEQQQQAASKKRRLDAPASASVSPPPPPPASSSPAAASGAADPLAEGAQGGGGAAEDAATAAALSLPWAEMKRRLREFGEPITLFGESARARVDRLRRAEHDAASWQEDELEGGHRTRSRFAGEQAAQAAEHAEDAAGFEGDDDDDDDSGGTQRAGGHGRDSAHGTSHHKRKAAKRAPTALDGDANDDDDDARDERDLDKLVYRFFKAKLQAWERDLAARPDHVKRTAQGKIATKTMKQCKDYIRPLFKLCKQRQVPPDILPNLVEIVRFCRQGEFVLANDAYIKLAIGNAAWPIGVTMVGIHERTGREKINSNKQAHVMNNEAQRKYLTSVKRLVSYAQSVSNVLPSKKVA
ncbi:hypothetical protein PybrP1_003528 [[Pythium] brassicae (nom. inval.)]|nr:hypothetical protein PybrP1_003528 [[Pythium] brassicae (nom. inval.)]